MPLAVIAAIGEVIPIVGPWISGIIAVITMIALAPDKVIWVVLLFLLVQLLENNLLVPKIQGQYMRIHPAITIFLLFSGGYIGGILGVVLIVPITATIVELYKYVNQVLKKEDELSPRVGQ
jgi:predicted PurR-regulated permease PerM